MADKKKTLYHGEFREMGPVKVLVKTEPLESKFKKGTYFVELSIDGETRNLNPENDACLEFFRGRKGQTITVVAEGSREEATIVLVGEAVGARKTAQPARKAPEDKPQEKQASAPRGQAPAPDQSSDALVALANARRFVGKNRTLVLIGLKAAMSVAKIYDEVYKERMPDALLVATFSAMLFGSSGAGIQLHLPNKIDYNTLLPIPPEKKGEK